MLVLRQLFKQTIKVVKSDEQQSETIEEKENKLKNKCKEFKLIYELVSKKV